MFKPLPYRYLQAIHATRALQSHDLSGKGINSGSHTCFFDHTRTWRASPDEGSAQCRGHNRYNMDMNTHHPIQSNKANMKGWLWWPNDIRGYCGPRAFWHLSYRWGKTPKNLTQETCPDRGSNPSLLRDRRACYRLLHSGGLEEVCPYINHFSDILRFLSVSYKIMTIPIVFSFGVCCLSAHATT